MGGIGGMELLVVGLVALIVVGPKDLPGMFRTLGQFTAKAKRMGREFTSAMEAAADDAGVSDVTNTLRDVANPKKMGLDAVKKAVDFDVDLDLDPKSETGKLAAERKASRDATLAKAEEARRAKDATAASAKASVEKAIKARAEAAEPVKTSAKAKAKPKAKTATKTKTTAKPKTAAAKPKAKPKSPPKKPKAKS
jgi:sec-independent protein translocase protein TatB